MATCPQTVGPTWMSFIGIFGILISCQCSLAFVTDTPRLWGRNGLISSTGLSPTMLSMTEKLKHPPSYGCSTIDRGVPQNILRKWMVSAIMGLTWMMTPFPSFPSDPIVPPVEAMEQVVPSETQAASVSTPEGGTAVSVPDDSLKMLNPSRVKLFQPSGLVDEVWTLVNKYYIDQTFNGQDWNQVREKYKSKDEKSKDEEYSMKLVTEMVKSLGDKYSRVLDAKAYAAIQKFDLIGIGVTLMPNDQKEIIVGAPPIAGSVSAKAGMKVGDHVLAVNGVPTQGRTAFDIIDQIAENPNAKTVTMTVKSENADGDDSVRELVMERQFTEVSDPIRYKISEVRKDGTKVGFIRILEFNSLVKSRLEEALSNLQKEGANAFVIDLRGNPGGAFQSAVEISSLFFENKVATYVVDSNRVELPFRTAKGQLIVDPGVPVVIWINGRSASASEVLAGSLHDNCRAVVMGEKSFGKGLIQAVYGLKNGAGLVLTVARYITPNGTDIQGNGITPDIASGVPPFLPGLSTDSSKVDFLDISQRLDPNICRAPAR